jgi:hypothetical protein
MDDIGKYTAFFHDGSIISINHVGNNMIISMASAEIDAMKDNITLSKDSSIQGKLHIEGIKKIKEGSKLNKNTIKMKYEDAEIFHLKINKNQVEVQIQGHLTKMF